MKYRVLIAQSARDDAEAIYDWIRLDSVLQAERWLDGLQEAFNSLAVLPRLSRVAPETNHFGFKVHQKLYGKYRILFNIRRRTVVVIHVRHGARLPISDN